MTATTAPQPATFLRAALAVDATATTTMAVAIALGGAPLALALGLPQPLLHGAALALVPFVALVAFLATRQRPAALGVWAVIGMNLMWAVDSAVLLASGQVQPTALGTALVAMQAIGVVGLAAGEWVGLRCAN